MVKRSFAAFLLTAGAFMVSGCGGGGMVGEDAPTYPVSALLQENTQEIKLSGKATCRDGERKISLTIVPIDQRQAKLTVELENDTPVVVTADGTFFEDTRRTIYLYPNTTGAEVGVTYQYLVDTKTETANDKLVFYTDPTSLIYSGDPSVTNGVDLFGEALTICYMLWKEDGTDEDGNETHTRTKGVVRFTHLETK